MEMSERISVYAKFKGLPLSRMERIANLGNGTLSKLSNATKKSTFDKIGKAFPDLSMLWLMSGMGNMLIPATIGNVKHPAIISPNTTDRAPIITAGVKCMPNTDKLDYIKRHTDIPLCDIAIKDLPVTMWYEVDDLAMSPNLQIGDKVALVEDKTDITPGRLYVADTINRGMFLRALTKTPGGDFLCHAKNTEQYPDFQLLQADLIRLYRVVGMFRTNNNI